LENTFLKFTFSEFIFLKFIFFRIYFSKKITFQQTNEVSVTPTLNGLQLAGCLYWFNGVGLFCADGSHVSCTVMSCLFCLEIGRSIWAGFDACFSLHSHGQLPITLAFKINIFYLFLFLFFYCFSLHVCECPVKCYQQIRRVVVFLNLLIIILGLWILDVCVNDQKKREMLYLKP